MLLKGNLAMDTQAKEEIKSMVKDRFRSRDMILVQKKMSLGKYATTWYVSGTAKNTLKLKVALKC